MNDQPFAYIAFFREALDSGQPDHVAAPRLVAVRPMLRQITQDPYLRTLCRWPDNYNLEIIECYPDGSMENVTLDRFADPPRTKRHIHWTWHWDTPWRG